MGSINLPDDLQAALQRIAFARQTTVEALVARVLSEWAAQQRDASSSEAAPEGNDYGEFDNVEFILGLLKATGEDPPKPS